MSTNRKLLTKSKFKVGHECPNKLFFLGKKDFPSSNEENDFLKALAEGGFQVGELAKLYHPEGKNIDTLHKDQAITQTKELMQLDRVTIFEAAFSFGPFFIRVDIIEKFGNSIKLTEVKSKSFDADQIKEQGFFDKKGTNILAVWEPYLIDVAFQTYVLKKAHPELSVTSNLMLLDKSKVATVDGLNQKFLILPDSDTNAKIRLGAISSATAGQPLLEKICVDNEVGHLFNQKFGDDLSFSNYALWLAGIYVEDKFPGTPISKDCKSCEYRVSEEKKKSGGKSGFEYCFTKMENLKAADFAKTFVFDIGYFGSKSELFLKSKKYFAKDLLESDIELKEKPDGSGYSRSERQLIQVQSLNEIQKRIWVREDELKSEIESWSYPYHFIDFETSRVAIPFHKGLRPYEQIAFQFSHHMVTADGKITHKTQYLNLTPGKFPNFDFVRALREALSQDEGTIFQYWPHENTVLNEIRAQLIQAKSEIPDALLLIDFIESITSRKEGKVKIEGRRNMVDLCDVVSRYFFHRDMGGRTSIKKVFPAIVNESSYLKEKYSKSLDELGINSLARGNFILIKTENEKVKDPYKDLPPIFDDMAIAVDEEEDGILIDGELREGGAAMMAYARMQFSEMTDLQRKKVADALLRYCELDTLAMVLIWEYWAKDLLAKK